MLKRENRNWINEKNLDLEKEDDIDEEKEDCMSYCQFVEKSMRSKRFEILSGMLKGLSYDVIHLILYYEPNWLVLMSTFSRGHSVGLAQIDTDPDPNSVIIHNNANSIGSGNGIGILKIKTLYTDFVKLSCEYHGRRSTICTKYALRSYSQKKIEKFGLRQVYIDFQDGKPIFVISKNIFASIYSQRHDYFYITDQDDLITISEQGSFNFYRYSNISTAKSTGSNGPPMLVPDWHTTIQMSGEESTSKIFPTAFPGYFIFGADGALYLFNPYEKLCNRINKLPDNTDFEFECLKQAHCYGDDGSRMALYFIGHDPVDVVLFITIAKEKKIVITGQILEDSFDDDLVYEMRGITMNKNMLYIHTVQTVSRDRDEIDPSPRSFSYQSISHTMNQNISKPKN